MRGRGSSIAGNPVLIGAATVLVILVAMFLSYNANAGLPFVPSYQLKLEAPSAAALVTGNEVRIGGDARRRRRRDHHEAAARTARASPSSASSSSAPSTRCPRTRR